MASYNSKFTGEQIDAGIAAVTGKQDKLTAGNGIKISSSTISLTDSLNVSQIQCANFLTIGNNASGNNMLQAQNGASGTVLLPKQGGTLATTDDVTKIGGYSGDIRLGSNLSINQPSGASYTILDLAATDAIHFASGALTQTLHLNGTGTIYLPTGPGTLALKEDLPTPTPSVAGVTSLGGATGVITLATGLTMNGHALTSKVYYKHKIQGTVTLSDSKTYTAYLDGVLSNVDSTITPEEIGTTYYNYFNTPVILSSETESSVITGILTGESVWYSLGGESNSFSLTDITGATDVFEAI